MKKLGILVMAMVLVCGMSLGTFALDNPWTGDGAEVDVDLKVAEWGEVWSTVGTGQARDGDGPIILEVDNAAGNVDADSKAEDTLNHYANTDYEVSVQIDNDIPEWTRFHVILNPADNYDTVTEMQPWKDDSAEKIITWNRGDYSANNGTVYTGNEPGDTISLLTDTAVAQSNSDEVHYVMDAINGLPQETDTTRSLQVVYTISAQN